MRATLRERDTGNPIDTAEAELAQVDLSIDHVEVVQVTQDASNSVRLIQRKPTLVRVFTKIESGPDETIAGVPVELSGTRGGTALPGSPLSPINAGQAISAKTPDRKNKVHSHDFLLPDSWVDGEELDLEAVVNPGMTVEETDNKPNSAAGSFRLARTRGLAVRYLNVCFLLPGESEACPSGDTGSYSGFTRKVFPVEPDRFTYEPFRSPAPLWIGALSGSDTFGLDSFLLRARFKIFINRYFSQAVSAAGGLIEFDQLVVWIPEDVSGSIEGFADPL